ncbi:MAG: exodeoxyribonuclease VII large subunit [Halobacteriovoraceae bacterium]|nr:exodeoxyribonuclease VII large subunit [Halobacteriovoraceae bacterium]
MNVESVSQILGRIKSTLENNYFNVTVEGEISNFSKSSTGHYYLTISDESASLSVAVFRQDAIRNPILSKIKDGDKVIIAGQINVYQKRGTFQLVGKTLVTSGEGNLKLQFELLKKRLASEGLFDENIKKSIPKIPKRVAIITAWGSAALEDFLNIFSNKSIWMDITIIPAIVQGSKSEESLVLALQKAISFSMKNKNNSYDVIVISRGGGSMEDLWSFNSEKLAWEIYNCPIPIISAVGHQVDYSICDFVADFRCETPSAAATLLTEHQYFLKQQINKDLLRLKNCGQQIIAPLKYKLLECSPRNMISTIYSHLNFLKNKLHRLNIQGKLPIYLKIYDKRMAIDEARHTIHRILDKKLNTLQNRIEKNWGLLKVLGPQSVLERGYTYLIGPSGKIVKTKNDFDRLKSNDHLQLNFSDGIVTIIKD